MFLKKKESSGGLKIVTEFLEGGSLVEYLREIEKQKFKENDISTKDLDSNVRDIKRLEYLRMLELGKGITAGMDHLHQIKYYIEI